MSVFDCINLLQNKTLFPYSSPFFDKTKTLIHLLNEMGFNNQYENITEAIKHARELHTITREANATEQVETINTILEDLEQIQTSRDTFLQKDIVQHEKKLRDDLESTCQKYRFSMHQYLLHPFSQKKDFRNGKFFTGMCYGYGHQYTKIRLLSPNADWIAKLRGLHLTREVYEAQKNQCIKKKNQEIQHKRFDSAVLALTPIDCGKAIHSLVEQYPGSELSLIMVDIIDNKYCHDIRISLSKEGQLFFFDSNLGLFCLPNINLLTVFFSEFIMLYHHKSGYDYNHFKLDVLKHKNSVEDEQDTDKCKELCLQCVVGTKYKDDDLSCSECLDFYHWVKALCCLDYKKVYLSETEKQPTSSGFFGSLFGSQQQKANIPSNQNQHPENPLSLTRPYVPSKLI